MRASLGINGGPIVAEAVMIKLADTSGQQRAREAIYDAAQPAISGRHPSAAGSGQP